MQTIGTAVVMIRQQMPLFVLSDSKGRKGVIGEWSDGAGYGRRGGMNVGRATG